MKKITAFLLALLVLTMAGCGLTDDDAVWSETVSSEVISSADGGSSYAEAESFDAQEIGSSAAEETDASPAVEESSALSQEEETVSSAASSAEEAAQTDYYFRNSKLLNQHYEKHGIDMGFASAEEYEAAASAVINDPDALTKTESEDGDQVFYLEATNEFVVLSTDGYIRTYFNPSSGKSYYDRQ